MAIAENEKFHFGVERVKLCDCPFALHCQQPEKDKQNVDVAPLEKFMRTPMERGFGAIVTKVC